MQETKSAKISVVQFGSPKASEIVGYYAICIGMSEDSRVSMAAQLSPFVHLYRDQQNYGIFDADIYADPPNQLAEAHEEAYADSDGKLRVYIFPHKKHEGYEEAKIRIFNSSGADKVNKIGYIQDGRLIWLGCPVPLDAKYATATTMTLVEWNAVLEYSPLLGLMAYHGPYAFLTPLKMTRCDLIPPEVVPKPEKILYQKNSGKKVLIDVVAFEAKVTKKRCMQDAHYQGYEYTHGISNLKLLKDFIAGKIAKQSIIFPGRNTEQFIEASQDLALRYQLPDHIPRLLDADVQALTNQHKIRVQVINGINGFGVLAEQLIRKGEIVGFYSGDIQEALPGESAHHAFGICYEDSIAFSVNLVVNAYNKGNFVGLINHATNCNLDITLCAYKGFILVCYIANQNITPDTPLLVDYSQKFTQARINLSFALNGSIAFNGAANAKMKTVYDQGTTFFKAGKLQEAKQMFKQATALMANAPDENIAKAACNRSLGTAYFKLLAENPEKYTRRAINFLGQAQKHSQYADDSEIAKKLSSLSMPGI